MSTMVRKQIYIEAEQQAGLKALASGSGQSEAELIRQAIDLRLGARRLRRPDPALWAAERAYIKQLIQQGPVEGSRRWQREELHDR